MIHVSAELLLSSLGPHEAGENLFFSIQRKRHSRKRNIHMLTGYKWSGRGRGTRLWHIRTLDSRVSHLHTEANAQTRCCGGREHRRKTELHNSESHYLQGEGCNDDLAQTLTSLVYCVRN